jgi:hypothetical protein
MSNDDGEMLFRDIVEQHGGFERLTKSQLALCRRLALALCDDSIPTWQIGQLMAMLPQGAKADGTQPAAIYITPDPLTGEQLQQLAAGLRAYSPSSDVLAALVEDNTDLRSRLDRASLAFSMHDHGALYAALAGQDAPEPGLSPGDKSQKVEPVTTSIPADPPPKQIAPHPLSPAEAPSCRPPYAPGQHHADVFNPMVISPPGYARFEHGGRGE